MRAARKVKNNLQLLVERNDNGNGNKEVLLVITNRFNDPIQAAADTIKKITDLGLACHAEPFKKGKSYQTRENVSLVLFFTRKRKVVLMRGV